MEEKLTRFLDEMGDTADEVAAYLAGQGCVGLIGRADQCPVANALSRLLEGTPVAGTIRVGQAFVRYAGADPIRMPDAVAAFVRGFDGGFYPELVGRPRLP